MKIFKYNYIRHKQAIISIHVLTNFIFLSTSAKT